MKKGHGVADYLLFLDGMAAGAIEAKREGTTLTEVEVQTAKYSDAFPTMFRPPATAAVPVLNPILQNGVGWKDWKSWFGRGRCTIQLPHHAFAN